MFSFSKKLLPKTESCGIIFNRGDKVNVYDFDNTIYRGESTLNYYFFCVKHHPKLLRFVFIVLIELIKYKLCLVSEQQLMKLCEKYVISFLKDCPDAEKLAENFWEKNFHKIKSFYKEMHKENDVIISASFGFMLRPAMKRLGNKCLICSEVNLETGKIERLCFRRNKIDLFKYLCGGEIENFYTDSLNDMPLMKCAKNAFIVKGEKIERWSEK